MQVKNSNISIFAGDDSLKARHDALNGREAGNKGSSKSINASNLNKVADPIAQKKRAAKEKALKLVGDVFNNDKKLDDDMDSRRNHIQELKKEIHNNEGALSDIKEARKSLNKEYGLPEDFDGNEEQFSMLDKDKLSEYLECSEDLTKREKQYQKEINSSLYEIKTEDAVIRQTGIDRLKSHAMTDAVKEGEERMKEASEEIVGALMSEAKDSIDEKLKDTVEEAKEQKEKKEELEEKLEARKEEKKEQEELTEDILEGAKEKVSVTDTIEGAQQEIKDMMSKMKLIEDDIKGAAVDKNI